MPGSYGELGLGVVFNITALEEENFRHARITGESLDLEKASRGILYGYAAWEIFMRLIHPRQITAAILLDGDTLLTLKGYADEFCIAVYGNRLDLETLRELVLLASDYSLAPFHRRLIEKIALDRQPLVPMGYIDATGCLITEEWSRREHELCKKSGWPYAPQKLPRNLDSALLAELIEMRYPRIG